MHLTSIILGAVTYTALPVAANFLPRPYPTTTSIKTSSIKPSSTQKSSIVSPTIVSSAIAPPTTFVSATSSKPSSLVTSKTTIKGSSASASISATKISSIGSSLSRTSSSTSIGSAIPTKCPAAPGYIIEGNSRFLYYSGYGQASNASDDIGSYPPYTFTIPGTASVEQAADTCAADSVQGHYGREYYGFDLHYNLTSNVWVCIEYTGNPGTLYNFTDVGCGYLYTTI